MPLAIGILTRAIPYETVISIIGLMVLLPMVYFMAVKFPDPKKKQGFPMAEAFSLLKEPVLILMGFILFFESALEGITGNWTVTFLTSVNVSAQHALYALSGQVAAIAIVRLLLSRLLTRISARIILYAGFTLILAGGILLTLVSSFPLAFIALLLMGAGFAAGFPVILGYVGELYPEISGTAFSIVIVLALAGNSLLNYLVGMVSKLWGIVNFPVIIIICVVFMTLLYSIVSKIISKKIKV
jgi:FHS family glucose/mannose:H+ symporter-like MFS transporter